MRRPGVWPARCLAEIAQGRLRARAARVGHSDCVTTTAPEPAAHLSRYAQTFHAAVGGQHHVASPLGAWLLLALACPAAGGEDLAKLTEVLGCECQAAAETAAALLASPHPLVAAAAAVWCRPGSVSADWLAGLPEAVEQGAIPSQAESDGWARRTTSGLIDRFPITADPAIYLILASALATQVSWEQPFELAPASALGPDSPWVSAVSRVLRTPAAGRGHRQFIAATAAGDAAVHTARARDGLLVTSVAAAPDVAVADVIAAAHGLAIAQAVGADVARCSLYDLPLCDGPLWSLREEMSAQAGGELCTAVLPAWSAHSEHDLEDPSLGLAAAAHALGQGDPWDARQAAMARYSRTGFEAAAVTAVAVAMSMAAPRRGLRRVAELRFGHPYAVVAVTVDEHRDRATGEIRRGPWHGVPVFSAWVAEPGDARREPENAAHGGFAPAAPGL